MKAMVVRPHRRAMIAQIIQSPLQCPLHKPNSKEQSHSNIPQLLAFSEHAETAEVIASKEGG
jgi:hypothetical protein